MKLICPFHSLAYEIECYGRAVQVEKLVHPILQCGHSNLVEASHSVLIWYRTKDIALERLHYQLSTNIGLVQANNVQGVQGTSYNWLPKLYHCLNPAFDDV